MLMLLERVDCSDERSLGQLFLNGVFFCWTCEDALRPGPKVPGKTAIPAGSYVVRITMSPRFGVRMPLLLDVPGFSGIRIHPGNTAEDTDGCILPGYGRTPDGISDSRKAYANLFARLDAEEQRRGSVTRIVIRNTPSPS